MDLVNFQLKLSKNLEKFECGGVKMGLEEKLENEEKKEQKKIHEIMTSTVVAGVGVGLVEISRNKKLPIPERARLYLRLAGQGCFVRSAGKLIMDVKYIPKAVRHYAGRMKERLGYTSVEEEEDFPIES